MFKDSDCKSDICRGWMEGVLDEGSRMDCSLEPREGVSSEFDLLDRLMLRRSLCSCVCVFIQNFMCIVTGQLEIG